MEKTTHHQISPVIDWYWLRHDRIKKAHLGQAPNTSNESNGFWWHISLTENVWNVGKRITSCSRLFPLFCHTPGSCKAEASSRNGWQKDAKGILNLFNPATPALERKQSIDWIQWKDCAALQWRRMFLGFFPLAGHLRLLGMHGLITRNHGKNGWLFLNPTSKL